MFIDYDSYCSKPAEVLREVLQEADVSAELPEVTPFQNKRKAELECSEELKTKAYSIYNKLKALS
jgi:hypothetical protein